MFVDRISNELISKQNKKREPSSGFPFKIELFMLSYSQFANGSASISCAASKDISLFKAR